MLEAGLTFLLVIGVAYGSQGYTQQFIKEETADAQAQRVKNAAMAVDSLPRGYLELDLTEYRFKVDNGNFSIGFRDANHSVIIEEEVSTNSIDGPDEFTEMDGLCIKKTGSDPRIEFSSGEC